jgi:phosphoglycolate phosphatase-like HAD superfamily hydrolase
LQNLPLIVLRPLLIVLALGLGARAAAPDPLPLWNTGPVKQSIVAFVTAAVDRSSPGYIEPSDRIAVFDNDGTLWSEQPIYFQLAYALDRVKELAPQHPEWKTTQPFKAVLDGDMAALQKAGEKGLGELIMATHTGMTTDEFAVAATNWLARARHPACECPYTDRVYTPMLELLSYLRANGFKTYIVSGGTVEFMRAFAETVYGVPPEQVIGSSFATKFRIGADGKPELVREPRIDFIDDGPGKPVGINKFIGRRPVFAFGNSDGDQQMLEWTAAGSGPRFAGLVHHTDATREYAYDRTSKIGRLDKALDEANTKGWTVVDMSRDWRTVFPQAGVKQANKGDQP